jgi:putative ABC transport system permease protein
MKRFSVSATDSNDNKDHNFKRKLYVMKSFLKYFWRVLRGAPMQWALAGFSLVLGWCCFIASGGFIYHQLRYDRFHAKAQRIYRVIYDERHAEIPGDRCLATVGPTVGPALKEMFPGVENFVRLRYSPSWIVQHNNAQFWEQSVWYADSSLFTVFDFPLQEGNIATALSQTNDVIISREMEEKYFAGEDPIGKTLVMNGDIYSVSGVLKDIPDNSHLHFDFLLPFQSFRVPFGYPTSLTDWGWIAFHNYILLTPGANPGAIEAQLPNLVKMHFSPAGSRKFRLELQPLKNIYFGNARDEMIPAGNSTYVFILSFFTLLVLSAAAFNFANLFSAMCLARAKESGIRKALGAAKSAISWNITQAAILFVLITLLVSIVISLALERLLPWKPDLLGLSAVERTGALLMLLVAACLIGLLAAFYPSLIMTRLNFGALLRGSLGKAARRHFIRKAMLIAQFTVSLVIVFSVHIIWSQLNFLQHLDIGFAKDQILLLHMPGNAPGNKFHILRDRLSQIPGVTGVSIAGGRLDGHYGTVPIYTQATAPTGKAMAIMSVSFNFFRTAGVPIAAGSEFVVTRPDDTTRGVLINEAAARSMDWTPEQAIRKRITIGDIVANGEIIGVVKDFNFSSLHDPMAPMIFYYPRTHIEDVYIRFSAGQDIGVLSAVRRDWAGVMPEYPLEYRFMNDQLANLYSNDRQFQMMFIFFAVLSVIISSIGFYCLLTQDILYRLKELAIRKAIGASTFRISLLLLKHYFPLYIVAAILACPIGYTNMERWIHEFAYRVPIHWSIFPIYIFFFLILAIGTVMRLTLRTARANPIKYLRS